MIRIDRPAEAPARLAEGLASTGAMAQAHAAAPDVAGSAAQPFAFDAKIYGHASVKTALKKMQHGKCAYCEGAFEAFAAGDVEHFRPKAFTQQAKGQPKHYPGYYWLAYAWRNLLYSCEKCNRAIKRNIFPLHNPAARARSATDHLQAERPLLVDPCTEDPREHIRFRGNKPYALTPEGRTTIELMGLDRKELDAPRLAHIRLLEALQALASLDPNDQKLPEAVRVQVPRARETLPKLLEQSAVFASMGRDLVGAA
jgi:uncharacterized protein (TIGR02646 family)